MKSRTIYFLISFIAFFALMAAVFYQYWDNLEACILCLMQRFLFLGILVFALMAAIEPFKKPFWKYGSLSLLFIFDVVGIGIALRQIWLQHLPYSQRPLCAPNVDFIFDNYLWQEILPLFFTGSGDCGEVTWQLWGFSMASWSLFLFVIILALLLFALRKSSCR